jgi:radical SAM superfamily enzyme YgiQ (UPF0313 family)
MQCAVPELVAALCPPDAEIEIYNEKERDLPLDRDWDLVFFSYLHSYYEHTKTLSALFRGRGITTVAGGRHASTFAADASRWFDAVVVGEPEPNVPPVIEDFRRRRLQKTYAEPSPLELRPPPYRHDLIDMKTNYVRVSGIEASRGCPFQCNFCVLTGHEQYRFRPVSDVIAEIRDKAQWNKNLCGFLEDGFVFLDNNLGGSTKYLRELCEALVPLRKYWGCAVTFNVLQNQELVRLMARAGCRYVYTGLESLNPASLGSMDKKHNRLSDVARVVRSTFRAGIVLSVGLILGADGDTNAYLEKVPEYLEDLNFHSVTYLGIVCPYPETPFFRKLVAEDRLLSGVISRDLDGYTMCHRPTTIAPDEVIEHYKRLSRLLARPFKVLRHALGRAFDSAIPKFHATLAITAREVASMTHPLSNPERTFLAGRDPIEEWDAQHMLRLGIPVQRIDASLLRPERERVKLPIAS